MSTVLLAILACYGVTEIITSSYAARGFRSLFRDMMWELAPRWLGKHFVRWFVNDESREDEVILTDESETNYDGREAKGYDMIACSICVGFWVSIAVSLCAGCGWWFLAVYGGSVVLNRQER